MILALPARRSAEMTAARSEAKRPSPVSSGAIPAHNDPTLAVDEGADEGVPVAHRMDSVREGAWFDSDRQRESRERTGRGARTLRGGRRHVRGAVSMTHPAS